jgi:hypothetical protein
MSSSQPAETRTNEVRVSEYAKRAAGRWYVIVLTIVVAVGLVVLKGVSSTHGQYDATATVYMGQPLAPGGGVLAYPPYANPSAVTHVITSDSAESAAARAAGVPPAALSGRVTAHLLSSTTSTTSGTKTTAGNSFYSVEAQGPWGARKAGTIANTLAALVAQSANTYVNQKIAILDDSISTEQATIQRLTANNAIAQTTADRLARGAGTDASKAAILATLLSGISSNTANINGTQSQLSLNRLQLVSAKNIESAYVSTKANGHSVSATNRRSSLIVAAFVGLIVGIGLALAWDALRRRPANRAVA